MKLFVLLLISVSSWANCPNPTPYSYNPSKAPYHINKPPTHSPGFLACTIRVKSYERRSLTYFYANSNNDTQCAYPHTIKLIRRNYQTNEYVTSYDMSAEVNISEIYWQATLDGFGWMFTTSAPAIVTIKDDSGKTREAISFNANRPHYYEKGLFAEQDNTQLYMYSDRHQKEMPVTGITFSCYFR